MQVGYFVHICLGGFDAEKVPGIRGTCSTFFRSLCTRVRTSPFEISLSEYHDGSLVPWYWKPNISQACNGWILRFIQSKKTASPVIWLCLRSSIHSSRLGIWLSSTGFLFHSGLWIGGPGIITGRVWPWFSMHNHFGFQSITLLDSL